MKARDVMVSPVITVKQSCTVREVAETFLKHRISGAPVVDDQGKPAFALPIAFSAPPVATAPSPALGEHNAEVLGR